MSNWLKIEMPAKPCCTIMLAKKSDGLSEGETVSCPTCSTSWVRILDEVKKVSSDD